jgi:hypothetical protein
MFAGAVPRDTIPTNAGHQNALFAVLDFSQVPLVLQHARSVQPELDLSSTLVPPCACSVHRALFHVKNPAVVIFAGWATTRSHLVPLAAFHAHQTHFLMLLVQFLNRNVKAVPQAQCLLPELDSALLASQEHSGHTNQHQDVLTAPQDCFHPQKPRNAQSASSIVMKSPKTAEV